MIRKASATKRRSVSRRLYLVYVELAEIEPPIWRRLAVPGRRSLHAVHEILQTAMGWLDYHLYQFDIGGTRYDHPNPDDRDPASPDPRRYTLDQLGLLQGTRFGYTYDFGDDWHHELTVEGVTPLPSSFLLPVCLGGARACPPEDCGGVGGYGELVAAIRQPKSAAAREYREWLGRVYDPEELDLGAINARLGHHVARDRGSASRRST
jgi:hypothetical protein